VIEVIVPELSAALATAMWSSAVVTGSKTTLTEVTILQSSTPLTTVTW